MQDPGYSPRQDPVATEIERCNRKTEHIDLMSTIEDPILTKFRIDIDVTGSEHGRFHIHQCK